MMNDSPRPAPADEAWHEIDDLVGEIARLSKSDLPPTDFYVALLDRVVSGLAAVGGVVWTRSPAGGLAPQYEIRPSTDRPHDRRDGHEARSGLIRQVLETGEGRLVPPFAACAGGQPAANPTEFLLVLCPWTVDGAPAGVIEVFQRPGASPKAQHGYLRFLEAICELVAEYHRNRQLRDLQQRAADWQRIEQFTQRVHGSLELRATAYHIVNEGRLLLECDRVSVLVRRGARCRLLAVSGVDTLSRRANTVRHLQRLSKAVLAMDEPLWYTGAATDRAPQLEELISTYLDEAHARAVAVLPLKAPGTDPSRPRPIGALVVERFYGGFDDRLRSMAAAAASHSASALHNAIHLENMPLARLFRVLGRLLWFLQGRRLPATVLFLVAVAAAVTALIVVPADFSVESPGELQPQRLRDVFAPADGVVDDLRVAHADRVDKDQVLLVLRRPESDLEFKRVWGELQTARKRLASVEAERLQNPRETDDQRNRYRQLTAQQEELLELTKSLQEQYAILEQKQKEMEARSPLAGEVLTWNLKQLLEARPVTRGQVLMTVADLEGPWVLELRLPDRRVAHVLAAQREMGENLDVSFLLASDPGVQLRGELARVGMRTEVADAKDTFVLATVDIRRDDISQRMPGATVTARIHCGRRSIGYVWLHDLWDAVQAWLMF